MYKCFCTQHGGCFVSAATKLRCNKRTREQACLDQVRDGDGPNSDPEESEEGSEDAEGDPDIDTDDANAQSFACQMVEQVVRGRVTVKGVTDILKIFQHHYGALLPRGTRLPSSWYIVRKLASKGESPPCDLRDVCPDCDNLFPPSPNRDPTCSRCGKTRRWHDRREGEAVRQAAYFDIGHDFRQFFEVEAMADALDEFASIEPKSGPIRDCQLDGAIDGSILRDLHLKEDVLSLDSSEEEATEVHDDKEGEALSGQDDSDHSVSSSSTRARTGNSEESEDSEVAY